MEDRTWVHSFQLTNDNSPGSSGTTFYSNNLWVLTWFETVQKPGCPVTFHEHYILLKASSTLNHPLNYGDRTVLDVKGVPVNAFPVAEYGRCGSISRICSPGTFYRYQEGEGWRTDPMLRFVVCWNLLPWYSNIVWSLLLGVARGVSRRLSALLLFRSTSPKHASDY